MAVALGVFYKVVLLGDKHVGKSSLMERLVHQKFNPQYTMTIGKGWFHTRWVRFTFV